MDLDKKDFFQESADLPHNISVEKSVLGTIINNNNTYDEISSIIGWEDFWEQFHQKLFKKIRLKLEMGQIADRITLIEFFEREEVGIDYLNEICKLSFSDNIKQYCELLVELSTRRELITMSHWILSKSKDDETVKSQMDILEKKIFDIQNKYCSTSKNFFEFGAGAKHVLDLTSQMLANNKLTAGLPTGFDGLDGFIGGLKKGELIILAGRPGTGKTALATNIALKVAQSNSKVLFISLEMPYEQICYRSISVLTGVPLYQLIQAKISRFTLNECLKAIDKFSSLPFFIYDSSFLTIGGLRTIIRRIKREYKLDLLIIDYLQLIETSIRPESREQEISKISRSLKLLSKEFSIPIIALSQLSREIEKRKDNAEPKLSDLRGSGALEQDADIVGLLGEVEEEIILYIAKNRNGQTGMIKMIFDSSIVTFREKIL